MLRVWLIALFLLAVGILPTFCDWQEPELIPQGESCHLCEFKELKK